MNCVLLLSSLRKSEYTDDSEAIIDVLGYL